MKFRKIPVVIEALQLTWANWNAICEFVPKPWFVEGVYLDAAGNVIEDANGRIGLKMKTLESQEFIAQENDWIIKGVAGEFYPCKPEIFGKTYESIEDGPLSAS